MKVLVTGGAGFIGSHVVDQLRERGDDVVVVDSLDAGVWRHPPSYLRDDVEYIFSDLRWWRPDPSLQDVEGIVHLAALGGVSRAAVDTENVVGANTSGTLRLREFASSLPGLKAIVHAGSFSVYGSNYSYRCARCGAERDGSRRTSDLEQGIFDVRCRTCGTPVDIQPIGDTATPNPLEPYGASKYMQELCWRGFDRAPVHVLRFSSVYGTRLRVDDGEATIIAKLIGWIARGERPRLYEDGEQIRDWVYVGDVVAAILASLHRPGPGTLTNVCSGVPQSLASACRVIAESLGCAVEPQVVGGFRSGDMRHCLGDPRKLAALIGRSPTELREGMAQVVGQSVHS